MSLIDDVKRAVENETRGCEPDGDPMPMLLYVTGEGERMVMGLATPEEMADETAMLMAASMMVDEAVEGYYSSFVYTVTEMREEVVNEARESGGWSGPMPREHPDRVEQAMIAHYTVDGGKLYFASVTRHPDAAPTLGEWEQDTEWESLSGRICRAMEVGIRSTATMPDELRAAMRAARAADARDGAIRGVMRAMAGE